MQQIPMRDFDSAGQPAYLADDVVRFLGEMSRGLRSDTIAPTEAQGFSMEVLDRAAQLDDGNETDRWDAERLRAGVRELIASLKSRSTQQRTKTTPRRETPEEEQRRLLEGFTQMVVQKMDAGTGTAAGAEQSRNLGEREALERPE